MKVCMILPKGLPVPAILGGAIESLMTDIVNSNEIYKKLDLTVVSTYNEEALKLTKGFKHSKFIYIDTNSFEFKKKAILVRIKNLFGKHLNTYNEVALDKIKNNKYDYILIEDGAYKAFGSYLKYFTKDQMMVHFHHNGVSDKYTDKTFSHFIGVSEFVTNTFSKTSNIEKCTVLKNGVDISKFNINMTKKQREKIRTSMGFTNDDFVVLFCGRIVKEKGVLELIQAINKIKNKHVKLMIVGSTNFGASNSSEYASMIKELVDGSNGRIKATGFIDNALLYQYYKSADIGVIPSICEDAAPLTTIEIMASGLPLILTKTGGAPEYASKDSIIVPKDGRIVSCLKKEIEALYKDDKRRAKMKKSGIETSKKYTTENFYFDFANIFLEK